MNIYFACTITGGRNDEAVYQAIVEALLVDGHTIPTAHLSLTDVTKLEAISDPVEIFNRDIAWIATCDSLVAEVSTPSHGVGYEIAFALACKKPVLCTYRAGIPISKMITGNTLPELHVHPYNNIDEAVFIVRDFIRRL